MEAAAASRDAGHHLDRAWVLDPAAVVFGRRVTAWTEAWWRWTFAVPAAANPELVLDADCGVGQSGPVFFVPSYDGAETFERTCAVPAWRPVLVPLWVVVNDYPCPDPSFQPAPGQSLEAFLTEGARAYDDLVTGLTVTVDGRAIDPGPHRHTTGLFEFTAEPSLVGQLPDACLQGVRQPGVGDGWWLMLALAPGRHVVDVHATTPWGSPFGATYRLNVTR